MKTKLSKRQVEAFAARVRPLQRLKCRCRARFQALGFDHSSPLYLAVARAHDALTSLWMELHYQSISHGVGERPDEA